jgi:hypothetical protein
MVRPASLKSRARSWLAEAEARHAERTARDEVLSAALVAVPFLLLLLVLEGSARAHVYMPDLTVFLHAGRAVLDGVSPYPPAHKALLSKGTSFVYPAPAAVVMAPLAALPYPLAAVIWTFVGLAAVAGALRLLDVRDSRCYGAAFLTVWGINGMGTGSISPLLMLGLAALWRYRNRRLAAAAVLTGLVCVKVFLWPFILWVALTGRLRTAVTAALASAVLCLSAWAAIDFRGLESYPHLLATLASAEQAKSYSPLALLLGLGASPLVAEVAVYLAGASFLGAAAVVAYRRRPSSDISAFTLCLVAALLFSPIVWPHYFLLLLVPVGILHKRLSAAWLIPVASWFSPPVKQSDGTIWIVLALLVAAATLIAAHWTASDAPEVYADPAAEAV